MTFLIHVGNFLFFKFPNTGEGQADSPDCRRGAVSAWHVNCAADAFLLGCCEKPSRWHALSSTCCHHIVCSAFLLSRLAVREKTAEEFHPSHLPSPE